MIFKPNAFAFACLISVAVGRGEPAFPQACRVIEGMVKNSACRLTECRLAGSTKVRFEADGTTGLDARGDLRLLDHVCSSDTPISTIVPGQVRLLEASGFAVQGTARIEASYASVVMKKDAQWIEVNAMVLEGAPSVAVRFIHEGVSLNSRPAVVSKSKPIVEPAPLPKWNEVNTG